MLLQRLASLLCASQQQAWATDDVAQIYDKCMADLEQHLHAIPPALAMNPQTQALRSLLEAVALARNSRDGIAALGLLQKVTVEAPDTLITPLSRRVLTRLDSNTVRATTVDVKDGVKRQFPSQHGSV